MPGARATSTGIGHQFTSPQKVKNPQKTKAFISFPGQSSRCQHLLTQLNDLLHHKVECQPISKLTICLNPLIVSGWSGIRQLRWIREISGSDQSVSKSDSVSDYPDQSVGQTSQTSQTSQTVSQTVCQTSRPAKLFLWLLNSLNINVNPFILIL